MLFSSGLSFLRRKTSLGALLALAAFPASADPIRHPTAIFAGLDKTTGRIINFDVAIDETVQFGSLQVTPRVCNTRPQTETPQTTSFVEIDEQPSKADRKREAASAKAEQKVETKRIFSGWMFAASPGLHGVEHPVYDVWLVDCKGGKEIVAQPAPGAPPAAAAAPSEGKKSGRARKVEPAAPAAVEAQPIGPADEPVFGENAKIDPALDPDQSAKPVDKPKERRKRRKPAPPVDAAPPADPGMPY
jgi:hypothetical protein